MVRYLRRQIMRVKPSVVGLAVAYVSVFGFNLVKKILDEGGVTEVRLVTDIKDCVTHPKALENAMLADGKSVWLITWEERFIRNCTSELRVSENLLA